MINHVCDIFMLTKCVADVSTVTPQTVTENTTETSKHFAMF